MKKILFLLLVLGGIGIFAPGVHAYEITCGDTDTIDATFDSQSSESVKKPIVLLACFNHLRENDQYGKPIKAVYTSFFTQQAFDYTGVSCWCRGTTANPALALTPTVQVNAAACTSHCQAANTTVANVDSSYIQRDNYCWCQEYTGADTTTCRNHRTKPGATAGTFEPISNSDDCTQYCRSLRYNNDPAKSGTVKHFERTYHAVYENTTDCAAPSGAAANTASSPQTPTTPAPTIRLFNPMAGASTVVDIVNRFIKILMGLVGAGALLMFIYGGIKWMTAGGDAKNVGEAQTILKNSTLGLLLLIFAYSIVSTFFSVIR